MAHFPTTFHVKAEPNSGLIRISIQVSEARVDEWRVSASTAKEVLALEGVDGWRGEGSLRVRFNRGTADVAVFDPAGNRTVIRCFPSAVKLFLAQLRAVVSEVPDEAIEERIIIRDNIQDELVAMKIGIIEVIKQEIAKLKGSLAASPIAAKPEKVSEKEEAVFIPKAAQVTGSIKTKTKTGDGVDDALKAGRGGR